MNTRGSASVSILLVLVLFGLAIVTMVVGGAGDHDLAMRRIDGIRTFYAAEAGVNMAKRELALGIDEDGDGGIGTIAPFASLIGASASVTAEPDGEFVTLRSRGAGHEAHRVIEVLARIPSSAGEPVAMIAYGKDGNNRPAFRLWDAETNTWQNEALANSVGDVPYWIALRGHPTAQRFALAALGNDQRITVQLFDVASGTWTAPFVVTADAGENVSRVFDMAFEQSSGRLVIAYRRGSSNAIGIRTHDGAFPGTWSSESTFSPHNKAPQWVRLSTQPNANAMFLASSADDNGKHGQTSTWIGAKFTSPDWLDAGLTATEHNHVDAVFTSSGAMAVNASKSAVTFRTLSGGSWSKGSDMAKIGSTPQWNRLAAQPNGNEVALATLTEDNRVYANVWNGSFWGANVEVTSSAGDNNRRGLDIAYECNTGRPLLFYDRGSNTLRYRIWNGSSWSGENNGPIGGSSPIWTVQAHTGINDGHIFVMWASDEPNIHVAVWNGSSFITQLNLGKSSAPKEYEPFSIAVANNSGGSGGSGALEVLAWGESAP